VTFIKLKAKIIRYNIFFLETQKNKLLYILMYTNKVQVFFGFFSFFFKAAGSHCHNMAKSLSGRAVVLWGGLMMRKWRMRDDR